MTDTAVEYNIEFVELDGAACVWAGSQGEVRPVTHSAFIPPLPPPLPLPYICLGQGQRAHAFRGWTVEAYPIEHRV
jgi:hypothetical protein